MRTTAFVTPLVVLSVTAMQAQEGRLCEQIRRVGGLNAEQFEKFINQNATGGFVIKRDGETPELYLSTLLVAGTATDQVHARAAAKAVVGELEKCHASYQWTKSFKPVQIGDHQRTAFVMALSYECSMRAANVDDARKQVRACLDKSWTQRYGDFFKSSFGLSISVDRRQLNQPEVTISFQYTIE